MKTSGFLRSAATLILCISSVSGHAFSQDDQHVSRRDVKYADIPASAVKKAFEAMKDRWYNTTDSSWLNGYQDRLRMTGIAVDSILDYVSVTNDTNALDMVKESVEHQSGEVVWYPEGGGLFRDSWSDITTTWATALVRVYDQTRNKMYLEISQIDEEHLWKHWDTSICHGGLTDYMPDNQTTQAISSAQYIQLLAMLHNRIPDDEKYLERAIMAMEWFEGSPFINEDNLIYSALTDTMKEECKSDSGYFTYTHVQGVMLGAYAELYRATDDEEYLKKGKAIADAVLASNELSPDGILMEPCREDYCSFFNPSHKGLFVRHLADFSNELGDDPYRKYLIDNAESMYENARAANGTGLYSENWKGPFDEATIASQISALSMLAYVVNLS